MAKVTTLKGDIDEELLKIRTMQSEDDRQIIVAREWYLGDELVRRDAWVTLKRGEEIGTQPGKLG